MKARIRTFTILWCGAEMKTKVRIHPKRVWEVDKSNEKVTLTSGFVSIELDYEAYEKYFVEI